MISGLPKSLLQAKAMTPLPLIGKSRMPRSGRKLLCCMSPPGGLTCLLVECTPKVPPLVHLFFSFFQKSTTRSYYLMNFSHVSMRGAEIWHIWKQHHLIECFWKILKSIFHIRAMQLQGHGLYTALLIKVFAYLLAIRLQAHRLFSKLTITQIMRN